MSKANPEYKPDKDHFCDLHNRYKIRDFGGGSICIECKFLEFVDKYNVRGETYEMS